LGRFSSRRECGCPPNNFALIDEDTEERAIDSRFPIRAIEKNVGRLASKFEGDALECVRRTLDDNFPTAALPVNAILSTPGCATSAAPAVSPSPLTILMTPGGKPSSSNQLATSIMVSGVCSQA